MREINKNKKDHSKLQIVKASWPPIVDEELFAKVQERLHANKNRYKPTEWKTYAYPLTEKVVCGECGKNMGGKSAHGRSEKYHYYGHPRKLHTDGVAHLKRCRIEKVRAERTEDMVLKFLKETLSSPQKINEMIRVYQKQSVTERPGLDGKLKTLELEVRFLEKKRENLLERISDLPKEISADLFYEKIKEISKKLDSAHELKHTS